MRRQIALLSTFLLSTLFLSAGHTVAQSPSLVFNHVTVIDMTGAPPKSDMAVVVVGDRIAALGKAGAVRVPKGAQVVDATGKYLIPGLWDMHAHVFHYRLPEPPDAYDFPLFIANGVTSIREMWTKADRMDQVRLWRQQFYERPGTIPRFAAVGTLVDGPAGIWPNSDRVSTADEARRLVGTLKAGGVDFVKVYNELSREAYFAIADEATKRKIPFAGHVPTAITWREASEAGQQSIEHLAGIAGIFTDCAFMERMAKTALPNAIATNSPARPFMEQALELCDDQKALAFFQGLAKRGTSEVPTLIIYETAATDSETLYRDERLKVHARRKRSLQPPAEPHPGGIGCGPEDSAKDAGDG